MAELESLPPAYAARRFVPADANLLDPATVTALYMLLLERTIASEAELEAWAEDESELVSTIDEAGSRLFANMTCNTDDPVHASAYRTYTDTIPPALKPLSDAFRKQYLTLRGRFPRMSPRLAVYDRYLESDVALFRDANVPLQTQEDLLSQDYQTLMGAQLTTFNEKTYTPQQMMKFLEEPDRDLREAAWRALSRRRLMDKDKVHAIFAEQVRVRHQQAVNAGLGDYVDYAFAQKHRYDYTREDCRTFHAAVEKHFTPLRGQMLERRRKALGLEWLRPWDLYVDTEGRPPLKPFADAAELIEKTHRIFEEVDPELAAHFEELRRAKLLDLDNRKGKAPGGYQLSFQEARCPFIFMNAVGVDNDIRTLLHEGGHAFHTVLCAHLAVLPYRDPPVEFCEVASFGMELLGGEFLHHFYSDDADRMRSRRDFFEAKVSIFPWVATVDAFQHWLYEQHAFEPSRATAEWVATMNRYSSGVVDWSGLEEEQAHIWHAQNHFFTVPMYYIEYGIAQLGALQLWVQSREDRGKALRHYKEALSLGGSTSLPELFAAAGIEFDLGARAMSVAARTVAAELAVAE